MFSKTLYLITTRLTTLLCFAFIPVTGPKYHRIWYPLLPILPLISTEIPWHHSLSSLAFIYFSLPLSCLLSCFLVLSTFALEGWPFKATPPGKHTVPVLQGDKLINQTKSLVLWLFLAPCLLFSTQPFRFLKGWMWPLISLHCSKIWLCSLDESVLQA